jgi:hypothetical protein
MTRASMYLPDDPRLLRLDTTASSPTESAAAILRHIA